MQATSVTNALTIDVEDYFHVAAFADAIPRTQWSHMEYRAEANTERLLEILATHQVRATFFVLGWVAARSPALVRTIQNAGHEIASHGMSHRLVYNQTLEEFSRETRESKAMLEDITSSAVDGYRASTYSITKRSLWALDVLCELGFKYDSSIFPITHDKYGIPDAVPFPSVITAPNGMSIVEFPMSAVKLFGVQIPVSGGGYFRLLPYAITRAGLGKINRKLGRPFVFYLHPWEIDTQQPRVNAGALSRFRHYTNIDSCESRLKRLLAEFRFSTMTDVLRSLNLVQGQPASRPMQIARPAAAVS